MSDPDARTLPAPARLPREVAAHPDGRGVLPAPRDLLGEPFPAHPDAPTPIPRRSSLEELRAEGDPWVGAVDALRAELLADADAREARVLQAIERRDTRHAELDARTSQTDLAQERKLADHETRMQRIEASSAEAAKVAGEGADDAATLKRELTGRIPPKLLGAVWTIAGIVTVALEVYRTLTGGR